MPIFKFGVLGAGVIGLTTALELQHQFPDSEVVIYSDKFNHQTTSAVAAGIFRPGTSFAIHSENLTRKIIFDSYEYYNHIRLYQSSENHGISEVSGYIFSSTHRYIVENDLIDRVVPLYRRATEEELRFCPGDWKFGSYFTTLLTECDSFLPWCLSRFQRQNGKVLAKKIYDFRDLENEKLNIIINCMGLGAKHICKDRKLIPIRGQVLKVSARWLKNFFYADYDTYVIPGQKTATLGGCRNYDSYDEKVNIYDSQAIWDRCTSLIPALRYCNVENAKVGLRPHRDPVRIAIENVDAVGKSMKIIHNYGHGGYGVTTAPGSARYVVQLVKQAHMSRSKI